MNLRKRSKPRAVAAPAGRAPRAGEKSPLPSNALDGYRTWEIGWRRRGWLVMWSAWRQTYTAFACFTPRPLIVDAPSIEALDVRLRHLESEYADRPIVSARRPEPALALINAAPSADRHRGRPYSAAAEAASPGPSAVAAPHHSRRGTAS